jgi:hypothetical protein
MADDAANVRKLLRQQAAIEPSAALPCAKAIC